MKLTSILLTVAFLQVSAKGFSQRITLSQKNTPLKKVFSELKKQSGYDFLYTNETLQRTSRVDVDVKGSSLEEALEACLKDQPVTWTIIDKTVVIKPRIAASDNIVVAPKPPITISGRVTDDKGEPVEGVTIRGKGQSYGAHTDAKGNFTVNATSTKDILVFSFIGFVTREIPIGNETFLTVVLTPEIKSADEVVVVGYGTQKKINLTGSVATISGSELKKTPTSNLTNALGGRMPGVIAVNSNGRPGSGSTIQIRGLSTLNDNSPLVVVDGIIRTDGFGNIDPNEVASISVLKDASAAAVYGARASNGVFLITTKRGKTGKPTITYTGMAGSQSATQYPKLMSSYEFASVRNDALKNQGYDPANPSQAGLFYSAADLEKFRPGITDWYKETFKKNSMQMQHNLSINGGTEAIRYFMSLGYLDQDGMYDNINFKRYNLRANVDAKITKSLNIGLNIDGRQENSNTPGWDANDIFNRVINVNPVRPAYYPDGRAFNSTGSHPIEMIRSSGYGNKVYNIFQGTLFFEQKLLFVDGLSIRGTGSYYKQTLLNKSFNTPYTMYDEDDAGNIINTKVVGGKTSLSQVYEGIDNHTLNLSLNYAKQFKKHDVGGLLLYEQFGSKGSTFTARKEDFATNVKDEFFASGPANQTIDGSGIINDARRSIVGRLNYAFDSRYLFEATFRYDGSYRFPKDSRFGLFPAFSAGWRVSEESFFKNSTAMRFMNNLKIRASKGLIGNDRVDAFQFSDAYSIVAGSGPIFNGLAAPYVQYGVYPNPGITWEKQDNTNIGLDANFFNSMLGLEFDYFFRETRDVLWSRDRSVPGTFGRALPNENYAKVKSKGFELTLTHQQQINSFHYNVRFTASYAVNKVTQIDDPSSALDFQKQLSRPIGYQAGYAALGLFRSQQEADEWYGGTQFGQKSLAGDIKYADVDGDKEITLNDQRVLSDFTNTPRMMYGLSGGIAWKNFDLNFLIQGAAQRNIMLSGSGRIMYQNGGSSNNFAYLADSWSPANPDAKYPLAWVDKRLMNDRNSDFWLKKAGYARLKSVDIGYNFNGNWLKRKNMQTLRVYAAGYNLFTWSQLKEFDPEVETGNGSYYPQQRNINIGVNVSF
ncbi:TonB-dependent receptor [Chitinophaga sp. MM2321]|uniref:TonB-dependent receptor n=1 Tax=Chitinophaga sp. MM2321 TaxID=3137178 RepID=UPI0032D5B158